MGGKCFSHCSLFLINFVNEGKWEREEEEEKVSVPLLTTNRAETRSSDDDGNAR